MERSCPSRVIVFGARLFLDEWERLRSPDSHQDSSVTLQDTAAIPDTDYSGSTAFVDLDDEKFRSPEFLKELSTSFEKLQIIGISKSISPNQTIEVARMGVSEILTRDQYQTRVSSYAEAPAATDPPPVHTAGNQYTPASIIGISPRINEIKQIIDNLSDVDYPNAILFGETGTGKDLLAKVMHYCGVRKDKHFIEVNCSAIPDELFESELFGHKKGSFTGAKSDKIGLFEFADKGTIFLDEIGNLTISAQAKLLKILESRKLRPLGGVEEKDINVRVIAATNIDLEEAVKQNRFRQDLLFRLNLIAIHLPPLRERIEDISELAYHNFDFYRSLYSKPDLTISDSAIKKLLNHKWPGNVRELRNVIERAVLLSTGNKVDAEEISSAMRNGREKIRERRNIVIEIPEHGIPLKSIERQVVGEILNMVEWNRSEAARILNISRARLRRIMEENNLEKDRRTCVAPGTK
ncbi:MAG: hypothetical protein CVT49_04305 [candidate division Zixibacteria bacterium HGW-Zixibacteria-1]|nr:MAG: hypothetical protein CVT49_04305 [candidate division Zixibacteria bacterium HGW-Zixibacteria-1]